MQESDFEPLNKILITVYALGISIIWHMAQAPSSITCNRCSTDISSHQSFYTLAKNGMMYGFFCGRDCASLSDINRYLQAYVVKINATPESHSELVVIPDIKVLKQYQEELEKRKLWKKYLS